MIKHLVIIPYVGWGNTITIFKMSANSVDEALTVFMQEKDQRGVRTVVSKVVDIPYDAETVFAPTLSVRALTQDLQQPQSLKEEAN